MKKILLPAMIGSLVMLFACNDSTTDEMQNQDTSAASESSAAPAVDMLNKSFTLTSDQEVPANSSTGSGTADVSYDKGTKMLKFTINYSGLTGDATMAHIHGPAARGVNAGVAHDLTAKIQKAPSGSFTDSVMVDGTAIKEDSLLSGHYYFNIHTAKNPSGEIRGQIEF